MKEITMKDWSTIHELKRKLATIDPEDYAYVDKKILQSVHVDFSHLELISMVRSENDWRGLTFLECNFRHVNLSGVDFRGVRFENCDFQGASMRGANLQGTRFIQCNLTDVQLEGAWLEGVYYDYRTSGFAMTCPEEGAFIAFKKIFVYDEGQFFANHVIAKLEIPADALRSSATTRKCRASKAIVLEITSRDGTKSFTQGTSSYRPTFRYVVGETVRPRDAYEKDRWQECASGIHFFMTRDEAVAYNI